MAKQNAPQNFDVYKFLKAIKPFFIRPFWGAIATAFAFTGLSLITPGVYSRIGFAWCVYTHQELPADELGRQCTWDGQILTTSMLGLVVGIFLVLLSVFIIYINTVHNKEVAKPKPGVTLSIPSQGLSLHRAIGIRCARDGKQFAKVGISDEEYNSLVIDGSLGQPKYCKNSVELIYDLIAKLKPHKFSKLDFHEEGRKYVFTAHK
ncbi:MAG: hypothetical protein OQJ89_06335 [Kangiellaceae bacterium]|nr:hypothetical protein [Kangiellaceae bacterium]MCW9001064.1 hypothetical protein [Kangiellaceae bacterium]MCW9016560.1 hypothetical protein [Kangiellaceae bacterium]